MIKIISLALVASAILGSASADLCHPHIVEGYTTPLCHTRIATSARLPANAVIRNLQTSQPFIKQNKRIYTQSYYTDKAGVDAAHTSQSGVVWQYPEVASYGSNVAEDADPSGPIDCANLCNVDDECIAFTFKFGQCWLGSDGTQESTEAAPDGSTRNGWTTYFKTGSAKGRAAAVAAGIPMYDSSKECDFYFTNNEPCTLTSVAGTTGSVTEDTFSNLNGWDNALSLDDGTGNVWAGSAPSAFDTSLTTVSDGKLNLETAHVPSGSSVFTFPAADADCGCSYETYTTSMAAGNSAVGYGYYEATFKSTAEEFVNAFWFQGDTAEVNVLKVENGQATVSWYCFADQDNQETGSYTIPGTFDITEDHTATLHWTAEQLTVLVDGKIQYQEVTPSCLVGATMKPIFSVEVGESLPSTNGKSDGESFGKMTVNYFRSWSSSYIADSSLETPGCKSDSSEEWTGIYQGPVSGSWRTYCGAKLQGTHKMIVAGKGTISQCQNFCETINGCAGFWWAKNEQGKCRLYATPSIIWQAKSDYEQTKDNLKGNIVFLRPPTFRRADGSAQDAFATGTVALSETATDVNCATAAPENTGNFDEYCYNAPAAFGLRATIDIDNDGVAEYGCPYVTSEALKDGVRKSKACKASDCTNNPNCPVIDGVNSLPGFARIRAKFWNQAEHNTKVWGDGGSVNNVPNGGFGVIGTMDQDSCVRICDSQCSCQGVSWRAAKGECWLMSRGKAAPYRVVPGKKTNGGLLPPGGPLRYVQYVMYIKKGTDEVGQTSLCDTDALTAAGLY